MQESEGPLKHF